MSWICDCLHKTSVWKSGFRVYTQSPSKWECIANINHPLHGCLGVSGKENMHKTLTDIFMIRCMFCGQYPGIRILFLFDRWIAVEIQPVRVRRGRRAPSMRIESSSNLIPHLAPVHLSTDPSSPTQENPIDKSRQILCPSIVMHYDAVPNSCTDVKAPLGLAVRWILKT